MVPVPGAAEVEDFTVYPVVIPREVRLMRLQAALASGRISRRIHDINLRILRPYLIPSRELDLSPFAPQGDEEAMLILSAQVRRDLLDRFAESRRKSPEDELPFLMCGPRWRTWPPLLQALSVREPPTLERSPAGLVNILAMELLEHVDPDFEVLVYLHTHPTRGGGGILHPSSTDWNEWHRLWEKAPHLLMGVADCDMNTVTFYGNPAARLATALQTSGTKGPSTWVRVSPDHRAFSVRIETGDVRVEDGEPHR